MGFMTAQQRRTAMTARLFRSTHSAAAQRTDWHDSTMEQRIAAVWDLTLECLAWTQPDAHEPRLQRSVCRVERRRG
jgi:hypothetical protein